MISSNQVRPDIQLPLTYEKKVKAKKQYKRFLVPGGRPMVLKAELHKESKNGFKTINFRPPSVMIFSKNCFRGKKIIKKLDVLLIFEFL